jgi:pyruvate kinase
MNLYWGVHPVRRGQARSSEDMVRAAQQELVRNGLIRSGDVLGVVAGTQMASGSTNFMRLHVVPPEAEYPKTARRGKRRGEVRKAK